MEMRASDLVKRWGLVALAVLCLGAAPSRTKTYTAGQVISPTDVTENEDNIFSYLQAGVDTLRTGAVTSAAILDGAITSSDLGSSSVTSAAITDATIVSADIASETITTSNILNGTLSNADLSASAAIDFSKLATLTSGNLLVGSAGGVATSVAMSGDVAIVASGATTIQDNSVDGTDIAMGSDAQGDVYYYDGTNVVRLGAGTSGQFLQTQGAGANPQWAAAGSWALVETVALSGASKSTATLPTDADILKVVLDGVASSAGALTMTFNSTGGTAYTYIYVDGTTPTLARTAGAASFQLTDNSTHTMDGEIEFRRTVTSTLGHGVVFNLSNTNADDDPIPIRGLAEINANITTVDFASGSGALSGTVFVYKLDAS